LGNKYLDLKLMAMVADAPAQFHKVKGEAMALILDLLGRRVAPLCELSVWKKLCLPNGLPGLLSE
jgi:hypothetical protein